MSKRFGVLFTLLVGLLALRLAVTGEYLNYVRPVMRLWLITSAVVLIAVSLIGLGDRIISALWREEWSWFSPGETRGERPREVKPEDIDPHDLEVYEHGAPKAAWLLLLPVLALVAFPTKSLGSFAASRGASNQGTSQLGTAQGTSAPVSIPPPVPGATEMEMLDFLDKTYNDPSQSLAGKPVTIIGFVAPGEDSSDQFFLTRFMMACCAADARPVYISVSGYDGYIPPADTWVEVTGSWEPKGSDSRISRDGYPLPSLVAMRVAPITPPENPYTTFSSF